MDLGTVIAMATIDWALTVHQALKPEFSMSFSFNSNNPRTLSLHIIDEGMVGKVLKSNLLVGRGAQTLMPRLGNPNLCFHLTLESTQL